MSSAITIGESSDTHQVSIDIDALLATRLLIQAGSGGGKSYLIRKLLEEAFPRCPFIMIDPEGEFATLREKFDVLLVGKGGDTPAELRSAPLLARRVLEAGVSVVCDLFEMLPADRHRWVAAFLMALIDAPKALWRPYLVVIDEAHLFCPEKGAGESEASDAVISLATRGRKRGFGAVLATQRIGKLRKDTAAELQNVLIGRTVLDLDRDRAADALGIPRKDRTDFGRRLKALPAGRFFAQGRAFPGIDDQVEVQIGKVLTTHPQAGVRTAEPPPPTATVLRLFERFRDLPKEAARKEQTEADLRGEIRRLERELTQARAAVPAPPPPVEVEVPTVPKGLPEAIQELHRRANAVMSHAEVIMAGLLAAGVLEGDLHRTPALRPVGQPPAPRAPVTNGHAPPARPTASGRGGAEKKILQALASRRPDPLSKGQVATLAGYAASGGGFNNALSALKTAGLIRKDGDIIFLTPEGLSELGPDAPAAPAGGEEIVSLWTGKLPGGAGKILRWVASQRGPVTKDQMADAVGMDSGGGGFNNYVSALRSNGLIEKAIGGYRIKPELAL